MDDHSLLTNLAIDAALESRWPEALKLNQKIVKVEPENIDALNRLARAFFELGKLPQAKKYYSLALKVDPYNPIAQKNLKIIKTFKKNGKPQAVNGQARISSSLFLQEPGKTKVTSLLKVAEPQKLSIIYCGMPVELVIKARGITIVDLSGSYLGVLPDDLSHTLIRLFKGGNKYQALVKSVKVNGLSILIRETFRSKKFKNQPSFLDASSNPPSPETLPFRIADVESDYEEEGEEQVI